MICGSGSPCKRNLIKRNLTSRKRCSLIGHPNSSAVEQFCSTCFPDPLDVHYAIMLTSVGSGYETGSVTETEVGKSGPVSRYSLTRDILSARIIHARIFYLAGYYVLVRFILPWYILSYLG